MQVAAAAAAAAAGAAQFSDARKGRRAAPVDCQSSSRPTSLADEQTRSAARHGAGPQNESIRPEAVQTDPNRPNELITAQRKLNTSKFH